MGSNDGARNRFLIVIAVLAIVFGTALRFRNLDTKLYTNDEATTSVHVSGHTIADFEAAADAGAIANVAAALRFQGIDPRTTAWDVVTSLAVEDPQHPPLFYLFERGWERLAGTSVAARRALPAVFGALAIFAAYGFGAVLLGRPFGLVLAALTAVSPFHLLYAQQAREYSLWTVLVFVTGAALLIALRRGSRRAWTVYGLLLLCGLYTDVLFLLTLAGQALYVAVAERQRPREALVPFAITAAGALLAFSPWLAALVRGAKLITNNAYLGTRLPLKLFALKWLFNVGAVFFDAEYRWPVLALALLPILGFGLFGAYRLVRDGERRAWGYALAVGLVTAAAFVLPDALQHESRSTAGRYLIPLWIACAIAMAYAILAVGRYAPVALGALVAAGAFCGVVASDRQSWWGDAGIAPIGPVARLVRAATPPVTVAFRRESEWDFSVMELADEVSPAVRLRLLPPGAEPPRPEPGGTVFALDPTPGWLAAWAAQGWAPQAAFTASNGGRFEGLRREAARSRAAGGYAVGRVTLWRMRPTDS